MARSPINATRLSAIAAAKKLHRQLAIEARMKQAGGDIDIFAAIADLDIPLIFKPLTTALGLCLPKPLRGIMVTTRRSLHIQRFTAAHELGHIVLDHRASIDRHILERSPFVPDDGRDLQEVAADAFAAEFMLPRWLYLQHIRRQQWSLAHLRNPDIVYQLALRMGASYEATCWSLLGHQILPRGVVDTLLAARVARLKQAAGRGLMPAHGQADVWRFTERDDQSIACGNKDDLVTLALTENASSGYEWDTSKLTSAAFSIERNEALVPDLASGYGAPSTRHLALRIAEPKRSTLMLTERRPWMEPTSIDQSLTITLAFEGAETGGLSRIVRARHGAIAA